MPAIDPAFLVLAILALSLVLFVTEWVRFDLVAVGVALALSLTGCLSFAEAFAGFSSPAVLLIAAMYVFGAAMSRWGIAEGVGQRLLRARRGGETGLVFRVALVSGLLSSVLSNSGVVAILIPVLASEGRRGGVPVSRLLMPLAFGSLLGGLVTVVGTSHNLAINGAIERFGGVPFALFEFTPFGLLMVALGALYFLGPGRWLLPRKRIDETLTEHYQVRKFVTEVIVEPSSTLINRMLGDASLFEEQGVSVLGIVRPDATALLAPGAYTRIQREDVLILQGEPDAILRVRESLGVALVESAKLGEARITSSDVQLAEAVVPGGSGLEGRTLSGSQFHDASGLNVLALARHGELQPGRLGEIPLEVGDTLLVQGHRRDIERVRRERRLIVLGELERAPVGRGGIATVAILLGMLLVVAFDWMPLTEAAVLGALLLLMLGCLPLRELYSVIDWPAIVLVGGMLSLGVAFRTSGLNVKIAELVAALGKGAASPYLVVGLLLVVTIALTQVTSHVAAAVVMTPVALSVAAELGVGDRPLLMAVVTGASLGFMSPIAHQANAMVMGPGDYRYRDFLRVGTPLTVMLFVVAVALIPWIWPLEALG